jgi:GWxTD domain-containing protein
MRFLETWVATPLAQAVGWTLLHSLWEGAIISAALAVTLMAIRSARTRYAAACVAMLVMVGAFGLTLARVMPEGVYGLRTPNPPAFAAWNVRADMGASSSSDVGLAAVVPWLAPFWIVGVWVFALGQVAGWISVCRLRRRGVCCAPESWQKELARLSAQLRVSRPILLLESCLANVPMVVGHLRPAILMPIGLLAGLPAEQIEAILVHELAHIRRHDYLVNILQRSVECLLFYHPAAWWMSSVVRAERENCCDDVAVAISGNVQEYALALAALEQNRWSGRESALAASGGSLVKRIRRLLYPKGSNGVWTPLSAAAIIVTTAVVAFGAWPSNSPLQRFVAPQRPSSHEETSPYRRWLNEEVAYIISAEERAAFQKLTSDEEREKFIAQFWERRNPHPGSPHNTFKEEHYRRISYANEHFASSMPGWKTDRGRIYIMYGPPDELESHDKPHPSQEWKYHHLKGVGDNVILQFVDWKGNGEYHLQLPTGEERKKIIEQSPERRSSILRTPERKVQEEYYRRVAFANKHFATGSSPGWKTDRGYVYVTSGPPDEIAAKYYGLAPGPHIPYGMQVWTYRRVKGVGDNLSVQFNGHHGNG